jgi:hypothetical protein
MKWTLPTVVLFGAAACSTSTLMLDRLVVVSWVTNPNPVLMPPPVQLLDANTGKSLGQLQLPPPERTMLPAGTFNDFPCDAIFGPGGDLFVAEAGVAEAFDLPAPLTINSRILRFNSSNLKFRGVVAKFQGDGYGSVVPPIRLAWQSGNSITMYTNLRPTNPPGKSQAAFWTVDVGTGQVVFQSNFSDPNDTAPVGSSFFNLFPNTLLGINYGPDGNLWATEPLISGVVAIDPSTGKVLKRGASCPNFCNSIVGTPAFGPGGYLYTASGFGPGIVQVEQFAPPDYSQITNNVPTAFNGNESLGVDGNEVFPAVLDNAGVLHSVGNEGLYSLNLATSAQSFFPVAGLKVGIPDSMAYQHISVRGRK